MASEHRVKLHWQRQGSDFAYEKYPRDIQVDFEGGQKVIASSAAEFFGNPDYADPEQLLGAALSSCHLLTFLAYASKSRLVVDGYRDEVTAELGKNAEGRPCVTRVTMRPQVSFATPVDAAKVKELHEKSHRACFIANSVKCEVVVEPQL
ncbi:MAG: OsmC family protein [Bdellovibrionales bacterium]|nr:OsmC family protein [Bdellovibrionales bacterium]